VTRLCNLYNADLQWKLNHFDRRKNAKTVYDKNVEILNDEFVIQVASNKADISTLNTQFNEDLRALWKKHYTTYTELKSEQSNANTTINNRLHARNSKYEKERANLESAGLAEIDKVKAGIGKADKALEDATERHAEYEEQSAAFKTLTSELKEDEKKALAQAMTDAAVKWLEDHPRPR